MIKHLKIQNLLVDKPILLLILFFSSAIRFAAVDEKIKNFTPLEELIAPYSYDPTGRRDPFKATRIARLARPETLSPLQKWDLDKLSIVGIMWGGREPKEV